MRKIYIFLSITVFFVILFSAIVWYVLKTPSLPPTSPKSQPTPTEKVILPIPKNSDISTETLNDSQKKAIDSFYTQKSNPDIPVQWLDPQKDPQNIIIPFEKIARYKNISLPEEIQLIIDPTDYSFFRCDEKDGSSFGLQLVINPVNPPGYVGDIYLNTQKNLQNYRDQYINTLWPILYPDIPKTLLITEKPYQGKYLHAKEHDFIYDSTIFSNPQREKTFPLYYGMVANNLLFTTSKKCMLNTSLKLYDLVP